MQKKIRELNQELLTTDKEISLNPTELSILSSLSSNLSSGATATSASITGGLDLALKLTTTWPYPSRLPGLDLLRLLAIAPETATYTNSRGMNIVSLLEQSIVDNGPPAENNVMLAIRTFANLFDSAEGRELCIKEFDVIFSIAEASLKNKTTNRNLLVAITTLAINYAVLFTSASASSIPETKRFEYSIHWLELLVKVLNEQKDSEGIYRALVAVGTFVGGSDEIRTAAREVLGAKAAVEAAGRKVVDGRNKGMAREVIGVLG
jgi:phospholipase A-2-activating protein